MFSRLPLMLAAVCVGCVAPAFGDEVQLRERAAVTGKILAEKADQVIVDLGFTVLAIPRSHIVKTTRGEGAPTTGANDPKRVNIAASAASATETKRGLYSTYNTPPTEQSVRDLVTKLGEGVVQVRTPGGLGSGFILNDEGYLITNFHVIEGETQISIEVYHQKGSLLERTSFKQIRIVAMNKFADLALLQITDKDAPKFKNVRLGDADVLAVGERVFAIGSPLGLERTVTEGIVSTKTRQMQGSLYLQTTAQINPGNSGGPLFNMRGEVVGVTNMKITFGEGLGFAIPVEAVKYFLDHRDAYAYDTDNPSNAYRYLEPPSRTKDVKAAKKL